MAITYPIQMPLRSDGSTVVQSYNLQMVNKVGVTESPFTFKQQIQDYNAMRWELTFTTAPLYGEDATNFRGFLQSLKGRLGMFYFPIPQSSQANIGSSGTSTAGSDTMRFNLSSNNAHLLKKGFYFSHSNRLYMALEDFVNSSTAVNVTPNLRKNIANANTVYLNNPIGTFRLSSNTSEFAVDVTEGHSFTVACEEALVD